LLVVSSEVPGRDRVKWSSEVPRLGGAPPGGGHRQAYDLQLTQYDERGWRATFYTTGMEHSPTSATGTGWERTPWRAMQRAAWEGWELARSASERAGIVFGTKMLEASPP